MWVAAASGAQRSLPMVSRMRRSHRQADACRCHPTARISSQTRLPLSFSEVNRSPPNMIPPGGVVCTQDRPGAGNSKSEYLNPKQARRTKNPNPKPPPVRRQRFGHWCFGFWICLRFRISCFGFPVPGGTGLTAPPPATTMAPPQQRTELDPQDATTVRVRKSRQDGIFSSEGHLCHSRTRVLN
jgi:hypothetical protein